MAEKQKSATELRREKVLYNPKNGYDRLSKEDKVKMEALSGTYREFIDGGKTERESVNLTIELAEKEGYIPFKRGMELKKGDKVYAVNKGKSIILAKIGEKSLSEGAGIIAAHIDAPRIDLKTNPLYEDSELAYFKTHYYGGIRKYQWLALPLELRGVVALRDGTVVNLSIGASPSDPVLCITDLLPHLAAEQNKKVLAEAVSAEAMNVLLGSIPASDTEGADRTELAVMELLFEKYGFTEEDLQSAELSLVPVINSRDVGLDRSMIGGYGHDDRVCSYTALKALLDAGDVKKTAVCVLIDKEEIGSEGISGMQSHHFDTFMADLCDIQGVNVNECYENSFCISADVSAAFDPCYPEAFDKRNNAKLNYGLGICKATGVRGKGGASDANAETVAYVRNIFDGAEVFWQMAPLGRVDLGGGGTVAKYMANRNIETIDAGVPVLSMHAPFEIVSKLDVYMAYKGFLAFYKA